MKKKIVKFFGIFILSILFITGMEKIAVYAAEGTDGTEMQVVEPARLELQLGQAWAGIEFQMRTDAGIYPGTIVVGENGVLETEIGGSKTYILTCLNSSKTAPVPESGQNSKSMEKKTDPGETGDEREEDDEVTIGGIPVIHIGLFSIGMILAISSLIAIHVWKIRKVDEEEEQE